MPKELINLVFENELLYKVNNEVPLSKVTDSKLLHDAKAFSPMFFKDTGKEILFKEVKDSKADFSIVLSKLAFSKSTTSTFNDLKAPSPIVYKVF